MRVLDAPILSELHCWVNIRSGHLVQTRGKALSIMVFAVDRKFWIQTKKIKKKQ